MRGIVGQRPFDLLVILTFSASISMWVLFLDFIEPFCYHDMYYSSFVRTLFYCIKEPQSNLSHISFFGHQFNSLSILKLFSWKSCQCPPQWLCYFPSFRWLTQSNFLFLLLSFFLSYFFLLYIDMNDVVTKPRKKSLPSLPWMIRTCGKCWKIIQQHGFAWKRLLSKGWKSIERIHWRKVSSSSFF